MAYVYIGVILTNSLVYASYQFANGHSGQVAHRTRTCPKVKENTSPLF